MYAGDVVVLYYHGVKALRCRAEEEWVLQVFSSGGVVKVDGVSCGVCAVVVRG